MTPRSAAALLWMLEACGPDATPPIIGATAIEEAVVRDTYASFIASLRPELQEPPIAQFLLLDGPIGPQGGDHQGSYSPASAMIKIKRGLDRSSMMEVIRHEICHAVWQLLTPATRQGLYPLTADPSEAFAASCNQLPTPTDLHRYEGLWVCRHLVGEYAMQDLNAFNLLYGIELEPAPEPWSVNIGEVQVGPFVRVKPNATPISPTAFQVQHSYDAEPSDFNQYNLPAYVDTSAQAWVLHPDGPPPELVAEVEHDDAIPTPREDDGWIRFSRLRTELGPFTTAWAPTHVVDGPSHGVHFATDPNDAPIPGTCTTDRAELLQITSTDPPTTYVFSVHDDVFRWHTYTAAP